MTDLAAQEVQRPGALTLFFRAILRHWPVFLESLAGTLVLNLIGLATAMYSMTVYDRVIPNSGFQTLWVLTVGVGIAIVLELAIKQVRAVLVDRACKGIDLDL